MKDIAIFGAGGLGREIACLIKLINKNNPTWNFVGFFDETKKKGDTNEYGPFLGGMDDLNNVNRPLSLIVAIGSPLGLKGVVDRINNPFVDFPNLFAPDTLFLDENAISFGRGNVICIGCSFSCNVEIGDFNLFNGEINVGHDSLIGNYNSIMPATRISGRVEIGDYNFIGVGAVILPKVKIGLNTIIGANSTIIRKTKDSCTYIGNPAVLVKC